MVCLISLLWITEAWAFADPIVTKVNAASTQLANIGKAIVGISLVCSIIMLALGRSEWRWFLYILIAGIALTISDSIVQWLMA